MARLYYDVKFTGHDGKERGDTIQVMQNAIETPLVFECSFEDGETYLFETGDSITAKFRAPDGTDYTSTGTITPANGTNQFSWVRTVADVGLPDRYRLTFEVVHTTGDPDYSSFVDYVIVEVPGATITPPSALVGVTVAQAAWLALANASGVDASDLLTATIAAADFEPSLGNPATGGFVLSSTIAGVRSWIAQAAGAVWGGITGTLADQTDLNNALIAKYDKTDFSASPTAAEPLKADGSGGLQIESVGIRTSPISPYGMYLVLPNTNVTPRGLQIRALLNDGSTTQQSLIEANNRVGVPIFAIYTRASDGRGYIDFGGLIRTVAAEDASGFRFFSSISAAQFVQAKGLYLSDSFLATVSGVPSRLFVNPASATEKAAIIRLAATGTAPALEVQTSASAVIAHIDASGGALFDTVKISNVKAGATQVAAGAAATEVWKTASHATLPDNVLLIGV